ncbi:trypsin-like peptidase domain-containing protein, partial [Candidatus Curtissbacteria bacterium]|nr:trypsin-like peptidase domain-containing protein [Candidatus Curtissbacteria bacterium]
MRRLIALAIILILLLFTFSSLGDKFDLKISPKSQEQKVEEDRIKIQREESVVIDTVKKVGPSVITIVEDLPARTGAPFSFGPFSIFGFEGPTTTDPEPRNIGSGFVVSSDGLIVTNKHVVSDTSAKYQILTSSDKSYNVERIYRDPLNDIAILKISASGLAPVELGDSSNLQVGHFVIAIGTALGEFRNTVTTGVISGLGRGITAGSAFEGFAEKLDNVIQTDAAINPGNSGGPLLNSSSQVIGINTAIASSAQNIGFALPVNAIKTSLENFNKGGQFDRAFLGVSYRMID